jgi:tRNA-guanine family transglycosylase
MGCEYFEISYPFILADKGIAIQSRYDSIIEAGKFDALAGYDIKTIDLKSPNFENDHNILLKGCECFTCKSNLTRAYIHHLLKCHELNANTLLTLYYYCLKI